jgi:hypothetical protein
MHRFQPNEFGKTKIRQVWCSPFRIICLENYFFRKFLDLYAKFNTESIVATSSNGLRNSEISDKLINNIRVKIGTNRSKSAFSIDYSKFDRNVPDFAIDLFFCYIKNYLDLNDNELKIYQMLRYYTKYGPIIFNEKLYFKGKGMSSGSLITNYFDTWWNLVLFYMSKYLDDKGIDPNNYRDNIHFDTNHFVEFRSDIGVCGDDAIVYTTQSEIDIHRELCKIFGMKVTLNGSTNDPNSSFYFLGRYWNKYSEPWHTELYMSVHILYRTRWYRKEDVPFDISEYISAMRMMSICAPLANGLDYLYKTFNDYPPLIKLFKKTFFTYLKDYPTKDYEQKRVSDIYNWRMF